MNRILRLVLLKEIPEDANLRQHWNALVSRVAQPQVFYTYEWALAVHRAYGTTLRTLLVLGYDDQESLCGVAAFAVDAENRVSFLCATTGDYCDFIVENSHAAEFTAQVIETLRGSGQCDIILTNLPQDSPSFAAMHSAARQAGLWMYARTAYECAQVRFADMAIGPKGKLPLPRQRMVQRSLKAMGQAGPIAIDHQSVYEDVQPLLEELARAQAARLLINGKISNLLRPERRDFLAYLAQLLSSTGWLCFSRMKAGPRAIAWHYGFKFCGRWSLYQLTFVNDLEKHSPGFVLLFKLIEEAVREDGMFVADLGVGTEAYKESFANASARTMYVTLHRSRFSHWKEIARYRLAVAVTTWPRVERVARNLIEKVQRVKSRIRSSGMKSSIAWALSRMWRQWFRREEVLFFEPESARFSPHEDVSLQSVSYEILGEAAIKFYDDDSTLQYLLRSARRLREGTGEGFVLTDSDGAPAHFAWVNTFDGFYLAELDTPVKAPEADAVMLFDCWTPAGARGQGHYGRAVSLIAQEMRKRGKSPWIFSAAGNVASIQGLKKAGFKLRYSMVSRRVFGWRSISRINHGAETAAEMSVRA